MSAMSDYLENKLVDQLFRAQAAAGTATLYVGLYTAAPSDPNTTGTEVSGGSYARVAVTSSLANWAGTQAAASTVASSGTGGQTSNNNAITFPTPSATWGTVTHFAIYDAATTGNELFWGALTISKTINNGDTVSFPAGSLAITFA
jgi:hypothetical protein